MTHRVMVIDDHRDTLELMNEILVGEGYEVVAVESVHADLREVVEAMPDLLVIDLLLTTDPAGLTGWDIVRLARSHRYLGRVEILVVSADLTSLRGYIREATAMSRVRLLGKPFALDAFTVMVRDALRSRDAEEPVRVVRPRPAVMPKELPGLPH